MANHTPASTKDAFGAMTKVFVAVLICSFLLPDVALAQLGNVQGNLAGLLGALRGLSVVTVTIAIIYIGYKILFGGATFKELMPTIIGALIIASCSEIAQLLIENRN
ncbi:MAG: TrbC/VirB2 family protein [Campylobacteraceae bacterium]|jgi:type IV secretion system protein VirB2|nr:TrbC/VirB2 family protein [Campylobacteraceae bacterium]